MNKLLTFAIIIGLAFACKNKDNQSTETTFTDNNSTTITSTNETATNTSEERNSSKSNQSRTVTEKLADPKVIEAIKKIEDKTLTPIQVLKEMENAKTSGGMAALKSGLCSNNQRYMDSSLATLSRIEKILDINMTDMMDEMFSKGRFSEVDFEFKDEKINGNNATVTAIHKKSKKESTIKFVKENNSWKMCEDIKVGGENGNKDPFKSLSEEVEKIEKLNPEEKEKKKKEFQGYINMMKLMINAQKNKALDKKEN